MLETPTHPLSVVMPRRPYSESGRRQQRRAGAGSEGFWQSRLLEDGIRGVSGLDVVVDSDRPPRLRAQPDLVITGALPVKAAAAARSSVFTRRV
jgi:hypothetical protein